MSKEIHYNTRWDPATYDMLMELAAENKRSKVDVLRTLVRTAHRNLPRTHELARELIATRILISTIAKRLVDNGEVTGSELRKTISAIEYVLRELRG